MQRRCTGRQQPETPAQDDHNADDDDADDDDDDNIDINHNNAKLPPPKPMDDGVSDVDGDAVDDADADDDDDTDDDGDTGDDGDGGEVTFCRTRVWLPMIIPAPTSSGKRFPLCLQVML